MPAQVDTSVADYIASLDAQTAADSETLIELMTRISGHEPQLWNVGTIGFGTYHYRYDSGREGDGHTVGFYPRKGKITVYLMDGAAGHSRLLGQLGTHSLTGYCVIYKKLSDVDLSILEQIVRESYGSSRRWLGSGPSARSCGRRSRASSSSHRMDLAQRRARFRPALGERRRDERSG